MCTVLLDLSDDPARPTLVAANRDEMADRPFAPPAPHWDDQPDVIGGLDLLGGGTWLALRRDGFLAILLNRPFTLGPVSGRESRGTLPLVALRSDSAAEAARSVTAEPADRWQPCNLVLVDRREAHFVQRFASGHTTHERIPPGRHALAAGERNDPRMPRLRRVFPRMLAIPPTSDANRIDWSPWIALLSDRTPLLADDPLSAMNIATDSGFRTVSSSLISLPAHPDQPPSWAFAHGAPDRAPLQDVTVTAPPRP
ncbi:MAG: hypothetical protein EA398_10870 [Deltaproteobacteria bacterium]|nr:MAG: hypothetical protein EA398_10870 [Deltaproteobacteria bacterium]